MNTIFVFLIQPLFYFSLSRFSLSPNTANHSKIRREEICLELRRRKKQNVITYSFFFRRNFNSGFSSPPIFSQFARSRKAKDIEQYYICLLGKYRKDLYHTHALYLCPRDCSEEINRAKKNLYSERNFWHSLDFLLAIKKGFASGLFRAFQNAMGSAILRAIEVSIKNTQGLQHRTRGNFATELFKSPSGRLDFPSQN